MNRKRKKAVLLTGIILFLILLFLVEKQEKRQETASMANAFLKEDEGQQEASSERSETADATPENPSGEKENREEKKKGVSSGQKGKIALTFDDGPSPRYTPILLDGLAERNVKATFFVTGENAEKYPDIVRRESEEGHLVGNHTYHHVQLTDANQEQFREEITMTNEKIREITGKEVNFIRPPYGSWDKRYETELNMFPVLWDVDPLDWCTENVDAVVKNIVTKTKENDIILLHDMYPSSVTAALQAVDILKEQGYEFVTVEEILFD